MSAPHWRPAYIGIGSNLDSPSEQVGRGIAAIGELPDTLLILQSGQYRSAPLGPADQPDFINAVAAVLTELAPETLLSKLKSIERAHGRQAGAERWGPRVLDLDLLAYSSETRAGETLTLPHPGIVERNFVLLPWSEIAPQYIVPGLASVAELARSVSTQKPKIEKLTNKNR